MPHTFLQDLKKITDLLCTDDGLILEGKLIVLGIVTDHLTELRTKLEDEGLCVKTVWFIENCLIVDPLFVSAPTLDDLPGLGQIREPVGV